MRKLASIRRIADIQPIPGADAIEVCTIDGWKVVAQKAMGYKVGDLVVYFEIDSWIPHKIAPFLTKNAAIPKVFNGVEGERLKTIKLKGTTSQGLILPLSALPGYVNVEDRHFINIPNDKTSGSSDESLQNNESPER